MRPMRQKGQFALADMSNVVMLLVVTGIALSFSSYVMSELKDTTFAGTTINSSVTFTTNGTWYWLPYKSNGVLRLSNYTILLPTTAEDPGAGMAQFNYSTRHVGTKTQIMIYSNETYVHGKTYNVTYNALDDEGVQAFDNTSIGIRDFTSWLPIVAVVLGMVLVLVVLGSAFGGF